MDIYQQLRKEQFNELIKQCVFTKEVNNSLTGEGEVLVHKVHKTRLLLQIKTFNDLTSYNKVKEEASLRLMLTDRSVNRLVSISCKQMQQFCGNVFRIQLIHEYTQFSLQDAIQSKIKNRMMFEQQEIIQIIDQIMQSLLTLSSVNIRHGFIQPQNILFDKAQNQYKLSDIRFLSDTYEYKQQLLGFQEQCYLTPELFTEVGKRTFNPLYNYEKSEVFSLGITIIYCCMLTYPSVYNYDTFEMRGLDSQLDRIQLDYGTQIHDLIEGMVKYDEDKRYSINRAIKQLNNITSQHLKQTHSHKQLNSISSVSSISKTPPQKKEQLITQYQPQKTPQHQSQKRQDQSPLPQPRYPTTIEKQPGQFIFDNIASIKKTIDTTPISFQSLEKLKQDKSVPLQLMDASEVRWERDNQESFSLLGLDNYMNLNMNGQRQNRMLDSKDKQTKPCPSPISKMKTLHNQQDSHNRRSLQNQSDSHTNRSINMSITSYDFIDSIKIDAPTSLLSEFSRMDYKIPTPSYRTPNKQNYDTLNPKFNRDHDTQFKKISLN